MPIFDQGYQHWHGSLGGQAWRWLPITVRGARTQLKNRWVRVGILIALFPALLLSAFLAIWSLFEKNSSLLTPFLFFFQNLPDAIKSGPKGFRTALWTLAFRQFFSIQLFFSMILVLLIGPDLISQDLRFNAIPLYLSRPVRRFEYFLGKLGVIAAYLSVVTIVPVLVAFLLGIGFSLDPSVFVDTAWLLCGSIIFAGIVVVSAGLLMLALSSLSRNSRYVGAMWLALWLIGNVASGILVRTVRADWCPLVSSTENLNRIRDALIDTEAAWKQVSGVFGAAEEGLGAPPPGAASGRGRRRGLGFLLLRRPRQEPRGANSEAARPAASRERRSAFAPAEYPWQWSAGVLLGLGVLSCGILATRVRALDRLR
jgi:ABC-2 type transport system permease protein